MQKKNKNLYCLSPIHPFCNRLVEANSEECDKEDSSELRPTEELQSIQNSRWGTATISKLRNMYGNMNTNIKNYERPNNRRVFPSNKNRQNNTQSVYFRNKETCNNCGKYGHLFHQCKMPITSTGVIAFRYRKNTEKSNNVLVKGIEQNTNILEYLLICRKDTLGYIDFMRGKYSVYNKTYIINMLKQMTVTEKENLQTISFDKLWNNIWGDIYSNQYKSEEIISRSKYTLLSNGIRNVSVESKSNDLLDDEEYTLNSLINDIKNNTTSEFPIWREPEWGFPKGRRNNQENDFECAIREFSEETGYNSNSLHYMKNVLPFEEIFSGSNYKSYKHKYFLMYMNFEDTINIKNFQTSEVSKMEWKTFDQAIECIRPYNLEKINVISNVDSCIQKLTIEK